MGTLRLLRNFSNRFIEHTYCQVSEYLAFLAFFVLIQYISNEIAIKLIFTKSNGENTLTASLLQYAESVCHNTYLIQPLRHSVSSPCLQIKARSDMHNNERTMAASDWLQPKTKLRFSNMSEVYDNEPKTVLGFGFVLVLSQM